MKALQRSAEQTLLKYLNLKKRFPMSTCDLDCLDPKMNELFSSGYLFVSPIKDKQGRRVIIGVGSNLDPQKYTDEDHFKTHMITYETLLWDEETQIRGLTYFGDIKGVSTSQVLICLYLIQSCTQVSIVDINVYV
ncbi:alpha-tocopherol transfer protein-like [Diaphorina citri]|uniref:Alpha-tocopherol transfer protein-like n=1 Tax=Diaphorina citri TaxID=121845 RepID=A0A3Q0IR29_DIACI|nr:alpha-tocopherol transfer protein-like [Diaphorina citri]